MRKLNERVTGAIGVARAREELELLRDSPAYVEQRARLLLDELQPTLCKLAPGTVVVIDLVTGEFVTAPSRLEGLDAFEQRFEAGQTAATVEIASTS